jgi:hypothetical protein
MNPEILKLVIEVILKFAAEVTMSQSAKNQWVLPHQKNLCPFDANAVNMVHSL